jgi:hypothetical protein
MCALSHPLGHPSGAQHSKEKNMNAPGEAAQIRKPPTQWWANVCFRGSQAKHNFWGQCGRGVLISNPFQLYDLQCSFSLRCFIVFVTKEANRKVGMVE